jgi:hypothetical protein
MLWQTVHGSNATIGVDDAELIAAALNDIAAMA